MSTYSGNYYLSQAEMEANAAFIWGFFNNRGWSMNAVAAMLGNMQSESTINPGIFEGLNANSTTNGYGLVQWTPNTKIIDWMNANGYAIDDITGQCLRIIYELINGVQYYPTPSYPLTFTEFSTSEQTPEYLAKAFLYNYERPEILFQPIRESRARAWFDFLGGVTPIEPIPKKKMSKILLMFAGMKK